MKKLLLVFCSLFMLAGSAFGQTAKIQALFIFQFAKYTGWAKEDAHEPFVITVLGSQEIADELRKATTGKNVGGRNVEVATASTTGSIPKSDVIYIGDGFTGSPSSVSNSQAGRLVLIVGGKQGMCSQGAGVSLISNGNNVTFEASERNLNKRGLHISPKLLAMGTMVP